MGFRVHSGLIGGAFGNTSAFSVSDEDVNSISSKASPNDLLIIMGGGVSDIAQVFLIPDKEIPLGGNRKAVIQKG